LQPGERHAFSTGLSLALPHGYYSRIAPKSGLALKYGIDVLAGVIDAEYRGEYIVILLNTGHEPVEIGQGMKIAQLIIESCAQAVFTQVESLEDTSRAEGARGSTGV
jgi:dUTP pyrophosphatase